jgi:hypothetical protein
MREFGVAAATGKAAVIGVVKAAKPAATGELVPGGQEIGVGVAPAWELAYCSQLLTTAAIAVPTTTALFAAIPLVTTMVHPTGIVGTIDTGPISPIADTVDRLRGLALPSTGCSEVESLRLAANSAHSRVSGNPGPNIPSSIAALGPHFRGDEREKGCSELTASCFSWRYS